LSGAKNVFMRLNPSATGWHSSLKGSLIREDECSSLGEESVEQLSGCQVLKGIISSRFLLDQPFLTGRPQGVREL